LEDQKMIDVSYEKNPELYTDYEKCLSFLSTIDENDYEYPDEVTNFHIYTEVKTEKELECIKSFLATQNLEKTKLIVWSDYSIEDNPLIQPYKKYLDLRVWDSKREAENTPLQDEHEKLEAADYKHYLQSDLLRLLVLYKYGGIFVDMDIVFIRDFLPLLDQEFMYQWGSETDYAVEGACATVISAKKQSKFASELLEYVKTMPIIGNSTIWGKDMFAKMWREGKRYTILPCSFFNTEWMISIKHEQLSKDIEKGWWNPSPEMDMSKYLFLDAFSWHWHNSSHKGYVINDGCKFALLRERTNRLLRERGI